MFDEATTNAAISMNGDPLVSVRRAKLIPADAETAKFRESLTVCNRSMAIVAKCWDCLISGGEDFWVSSAQSIDFGGEAIGNV